ncbi:hypothetical protein B0J13DRAFT_94268 [Dactylonectria estremocensis]|uniref:Uncharacterized protein n=1 Tax=Dactylonectria estremocensis TaxID=1079267 RepID=A0A9P9IW35_9HYPO|nr:hypothetical protein B0J13DRAFT_94268 [Dactylonectria estremocensis]
MLLQSANPNHLQVAHHKSRQYFASDSPSSTYTYPPTLYYIVRPYLFIMTASRPPPDPSCWSWKCHGCGRTYNLAATRRCLHCSHRTCIGKPANKENRYRVCRSAFDYDGWASVGFYRRSQEDLAYAIQENQARQSKAELDEERLNRFINGTHDCSKDCDYPSECHNERLRTRPSRVEASPVDCPIDPALFETRETDDKAPYETIEKEDSLTNDNSGDNDASSDDNGSDDNGSDDNGTSDEETDQGEAGWKKDESSDESDGGTDLD